MATAAVAAHPTSRPTQGPNPVAFGAIALAGVALAVVELALAIPKDGNDIQVALLLWITLPYIVAGLIAWARRPDSRLGPLMIAGGFEIRVSALHLATVLTISSIPSMFANAQVVQANLKRIGVTLRVESVDYNQWVQRWQQKEFEATLNSSTGFADPDTAFYRAFHSKAQNWNNIANPELDRLLDEGRAVFEIEKRKPIYDKIQLHLLEKPGHLFLFSPEMIDVTQKTLHGFSQHPTTTLWSLQNVWIDD